MIKVEIVNKISKRAVEFKMFENIDRIHCNEIDRWTHRKAMEYDETYNFYDNQDICDMFEFQYKVKGGKVVYNFPMSDEFNF